METFFDLNWAEIFGFAGLIISITAHQTKQPKIALYTLCLASIAWSGHFYLLGETAYMIAFLNTFRNIFAAKLNPKHLVYVMVVYLSISFVFILSQTNEIKDLFPLIPISLIAYGILQKSKPHRFRSFYLAGESTWLIYGIIVGSTAFIFSTAFVTCSLIISLFRHDLSHKFNLCAAKEALKFNAVRQQPALIYLRVVKQKPLPPISSE